VGDVHQPLHSTARFTATDRNGDSGGNGVKVCLPTSAQCDATHNTSLHSFWDGALGTSNLPSSASAKAATMPKLTFGASVVQAPPNVWVAESFEVARLVVYDAPVGPANGPYRLTNEYRATAGSVAEQRVILAGARLASILNRQLD
jgi:hypothetical protein